MMSLFASHPAVVITLASFGSAFALVWFVIEQLGARRRHAEERLERFQNGSVSEPSESEGGVTPLRSPLGQWLERTAPPLAKHLQPKNERDANRLRLRVVQAGFRSEQALTIYLGIKALSCLAAALLAGSWVMATVGPGREGLLRMVLILSTAFLLPDLLLMLLTKHRKQAIFLGLPDALDLLVICVEAGMGLDQAMNKVAHQLRRAHPLLAREFLLSNTQLEMGATRVQVLRDLARRNGEPDLESLVSVLVQACKFGSGIAQALRTQSDAMRIRRRQIAEEKAAKCAVKLIFPLVLFIFPGIFVVLIGPATISIIRNFLTLGG